jgi:hypothetical protein
MTDTKKLKGKLVMSGLTAKDIAKAIKKSRTTTSYKMNNRREFKVSEINIICEMLGLTLEEKEEIFFAN